MSKLILKDRTEIVTMDYPYMGAIKVKVDDLAAAEALRAQLTPDNLSEVATTNDADLEVGHYHDQVLASMNADLLSTDGVIVTIGLRDKTETEKLNEKLDASQAIQDGAIGDLGEAVSNMMEGGAN